MQTSVSTDMDESKSAAIVNRFEPLLDKMA